MRHMLDAEANNFVGMSNLPTVFNAEQQLTLGAPFDEQYALYAPQGYGQDAFYLFPPDLLSMLIDAPADFDIEIVDQWRIDGLPKARPIRWTTGPGNRRPQSPRLAVG